MDIDNTSKKSLCMLEIIKWVFFVIMLMILVVGNYLYPNFSVLLRSIVFIFIFFIALYILSITKVGKCLILFGNESRIELKKIVWPSYRDGLNTTLIVIAVTVMVSLILWGLDALIVNMISFGLRL